MSKMKVTRPKTELIWFSTVEDGKKLVINTNDGDLSHDLVTITADDTDESLWFEMQNDQLVQIPLAVIKEALEVAAGEVHSETWYEKNVYNNT